MAVASAVETVALRLPTRCGDRADAAHHGEARLGAEPIRVIPNGDHYCACVLGAHAFELEQTGGELLDQGDDEPVEFGAEHNTLYVAIEISRKSWVVGIKSPASERIGLHSLGAADVVGLKDLIEHQQTKAERALGREVRVLCCYEAGYEGFWLARWLDRTMSVETVVLDPASLLVNRKLHGIFDLQPRAKGFEARFAEVRTAYESTFPPRARQEILRLAERLSLVERQIAQIEAERDAIVRQGEALAVPVAPEGSDAQAAARMATLTRLKGIGENDATLLTHEIFYRGFRNRRELASWVGITPTPWTSGDTQRDQGISRDGPAWIRAQLVQMAWRWLRHQPDSALSKWFEDRTAGGRGRIRRVMVVALARKLLIALWRFCETGLVPTGARLT